MGKLNARSSDLHSSRLLQTVLVNADLDWTHIELPSPPKPGNNFGEYAEELPDEDERWWSQERVNHILSQMYDRHLTVVNEMMKGEETSYVTVYKRVRSGQTRAEVRSDGIAGCLRTPSGGSSKQIVIASGGGEVKVRWMTAREYARLQGVPDDFPIDVGYIQALWGFGDAVCVPVISWIARHALNPLADEVEELIYV
jgi:DNA (cytosine-5)-methyltransferase 1